MLFKYKVFVILVNQSLNQHINSSLSTMDDAQCNKYLGNFISTPNFRLSFVLISITYYIIKKLNIAGKRKNHKYYLIQATTHFIMQ